MAVLVVVVSVCHVTMSHLTLHTGTVWHRLTAVCSFQLDWTRWLGVSWRMRTVSQQPSCNICREYLYYNIVTLLCHYTPLSWLYYENVIHKQDKRTLEIIVTADCPTLHDQELGAV